LNKFPKLNSDEIDFNFQSEAHLGTIFTSVTGFLTRIGFKKLGSIFDSNLLELQLPAGLKRGEEFYLSCSQHQVSIV
jgi:hypothetical protein